MLVPFFNWVVCGQYKYCLTSIIQHLDYTNPSTKLYSASLPPCYNCDTHNTTDF